MTKLCRFLLETKEDYDEIALAFTNINKFMQRGTLADGRQFTMWEGGDMKWIATKLGLRAQFSSGKACSWCEVDMSELSSLEPSTPRSLVRLRTGAHIPPLNGAQEPVYPFACPHCQIEFKDQSSWQAETLSEHALKAFPLKHAGSVWHRGPISMTDPSRFVLCILHLRLSFVNTLWSYCIKPSVRTTETAGTLNDLLQRDGINVRRLKAIKGISDLECIQQTKFTGKPADKFMAKFDKYLEAADANDQTKW